MKKEFTIVFCCSYDCMQLMEVAKNIAKKLNATFADNKVHVARNRKYLVLWNLPDSEKGCAEVSNDNLLIVAQNLTEVVNGKQIFCKDTQKILRKCFPEASWIEVKKSEISVLEAKIEKWVAQK